LGNIAKFDIIAGQYDTPERDRIAGIIAEAIRSRADSSAGKTAIDYGCGTGLVGLRLLDVFGSITFIDAAGNMVEQVRNKLVSLCANSAETLCCDLCGERPPGLKADCVFVVQTLLHEKNITALLENLHSVLNEDGRLLIVDFNKNENIVSDEVHNGFDQAELAELLRRLSFSVVESQTFYHGDKMFMNQDASLFILDAVKRR
jgi:ubiquinone/menaquinone biosynthesis C-methylase UbiE